jgi:hypothetical protein
MNLIYRTTTNFTWNYTAPPNSSLQTASYTLQHLNISLRYLNYCSLSRQSVNNDRRVVVRLLENSTMYSHKRENKMCSLYFHSKFFPNFSTSPPARNAFLHETLFSNLKDCTRGDILYSKNNPYRTSGPMSLCTFHQFIASAFGYKQRSPHLCDLRSIHEHFHTEHQHFCTSPKFIRTDNIIQCVHIFTSQTQMNTVTYNHITYNVDYQLNFYIIPN